jgi:hypothetical protein
MQSSHLNVERPDRVPEMLGAGGISARQLRWSFDLNVWTHGQRQGGLTKEEERFLRTSRGEEAVSAQAVERKRDFSHPQADAFAGANAEEKIGLLRSIPQLHSGCK